MILEREAGPVMKAEILEQPDTWRRVADTVYSFLEQRTLPRPLNAAFLKRVERIVVFGSGSSFHAALLASEYLELLAGIPSSAAHASEVFSREVPRPSRVLGLALSHSGGSTDVRQAVKRAHRQGIATVAILNVPDSPLARETDVALVSGAGSERAIPSTKGFTAALAASLLLASHAAAIRGRSIRVKPALLGAAARVEEWLSSEESMQELAAAAESLTRSRVAAFVGRGLLHPVACDGALKFLEVTYLPALAFPPDEFRHGPVAIVEEGFSLVSLAPRKREALIQEVRARGGQVIVLGSSGKSSSISLPRVPSLVAPLVFTPPLQLLAHSVGARLERPIDRPRHLQKVVG